MSKVQLDRSYASRQSTSSSVMTFMKTLDRLQEQQMVYSTKLEQENVRKLQLDDDIKNAKEILLKLQQKTRNGVIVNEEEKVNKKELHRLEKQLQAAKIKLSVARKDNTEMKSKIDNLRKDKLMHMQIMNDMEREIMKNKKKLKQGQNEINRINSSKHSTEIAITSTKQRIIRDMDDFSHELAATKQNIASSQEQILDTIQERLKATLEMGSLRKTAGTNTNHHNNNSTTTGNNNGELSEADQRKLREEEDHAVINELALMFQRAGLGSVEELINTLERSEEQIFTAYNEIQRKSEEIEKSELENKALEMKYNDQKSKVEGLESNNAKLREELENHIRLIQESIVQYDTSYATHMDVLDTIADSLMNLLKSVTVDGEALDQQLLSTGITDRNILDFLGLVEQRIDYLIQMSTAAMHTPLQREDFLRLAMHEHRHHVGLRAPALPSLLDHDGDDPAEDGGFGLASNVNGFDVDAGAVISGANARVQPINITLLKDHLKDIIKDMLKSGKSPETGSGTGKGKQSKNNTNYDAIGI